MLDAGAALNIQDSAGKTAMACTATKGAEDVAQTLIDMGAIPSIQDQPGQNALWWADNTNDALEGLASGNEGIAKLLSIAFATRVTSVVGNG